MTYLKTAKNLQLNIETKKCGWAPSEQTQKCGS